MPVTKGAGAKFEFGNAKTYAESTTWTEVADLTEIKPPEIEADDIDVSNLASPDQFKEFAAGWANGGEVELTLQYSKAQATSLYGLFRTDKGFRVTFADGSKWNVNGYIKKFGSEIDREGIVTNAVTVKVSGKPEFVAAPAA